MKVSDKFNMKTAAGSVYTIEIVNINEFREPMLKYMIDIYQGELYLGELFCSDSFFEQENVTKVGAE